MSHNLRVLVKEVLRICGDEGLKARHRKGVRSTSRETIAMSWYLYATSFTAVNQLTLHKLVDAG